MMLKTKPNSNQQLTAKTFLLHHYLGFELETQCFMAEFEIFQNKLDNFSCFTYELCYVWTAPLTLVSYEATIYKLASRAMA